MSTNSNKPILLIGGYGQVGTRAAHALRQLQPNLPLTIAGRDLAKARVVAATVGRADVTPIDLRESDLGLEADAEFAAVVVLLKDLRLNAMQYAQDKGIPYVSLSNYAFEIAPEVALYTRMPASAPILLFGHHLGGMATLAALYFAGEFRNVRQVAIGAVFDQAELAGATVQADTERVAAAAPRPLLRKDGQWLWAGEDDEGRRFTDSAGNEHQGHAYPLLDVVSLAAATGADFVRFDAAVRETASASPAHETVIELLGERADGSVARAHHALLDDDFHQRMTARGLAVALERLLGLAGGSPVPPGLYCPENLLVPEHAIQRMQALGTRVVRF